MTDEPDIPSRTLRVSLRQRDIVAEERVPAGFLREVAGLAAREAGLVQPAEMSLTLTDDRTIRRYNSRYRGIDQATDVLSFALEEGESPPLPDGMPRQLGDVLVSLETTYRNAGEYAVEPRTELAWVVAHGVLHLLGYDHQTRADLTRMRAVETRVLARLGLRREVPT